jgi:4-aminobutyrate aminotransferase
MEPLLPGALHVAPPDPAQCPWNCGAECSCACAEHVDYVMRREGDVGAVIVETVRATSLIPPPPYLPILREACDRHGALLIFDEIPLALGRTGRMFTCENFGVVPDMLLVGKALGGGIFPLAALIAREDLDVAGDAALGHYTHEKNPVACAAGLSTLQVIEEEGLVEHAKKLGEYTVNRLREMAQRHPLVGDIRGLGLILGVELLKDRATLAPASDEAERIMYAALQGGLNFKVTKGNVLTLTPALTLTQTEMDQALAILERALYSVETRGK